MTSNKSINGATNAIREATDSEKEKALNYSLDRIGELIDGMWMPGVNLCNIENALHYIRRVDGMIITERHSLTLLRNIDTDFYRGIIDDLSDRHDRVINYMKTKCHCTHKQE